MFQRVFQGMTGAEPDEQLPVLLSFLALLFLLLSYYLVKPLRDSLFLMYFQSRDLAYMSLPIIALSLAAAKFFNHWVGRVPRYRLMTLTYAVMMACKLLFLLLLPIAGRWTTVCFFLFVSVYFSLVLSILWGVINTIFNSRQAERCFGFVALGATLGNILGAKLSGWLAGSVLRDWSLLFSLVGMGGALGLILLAVRLSPAPTSAAAGQNPQQHVSRGIQDILTLWGNRYVRGIAVMVFTLALINMVTIQFQAYGQIDRSTAQAVYTTQFAWLDADQRQFDAVYALKKRSAAEIEQELTRLGSQRQLDVSQQARLRKSYAEYRKNLESRTRQIFSDVYAWQGILGVFLLVVVARLLFRFVGLRWTVLMLPAFFCASALALLFPLDVLALQMILVLAGALNYSLNNATKELLYTPTSESVRFQLKPLIEGPVMRLGDLTASVLQIGIAALGTWLVLSERLQGGLLLGTGLAMVAVWAWTSFETGRRYDAAQQAAQRGQTTEALDLHA
ncbi:MAG: hypothetical protein ACO1RX_10760 [Candidatus Sericytochromatia bacterium]